MQQLRAALQARLAQHPASAEAAAALQVARPPSAVDTSWHVLLSVLATPVTLSGVARGFDIHPRV